MVTVRSQDKKTIIKPDIIEQDQNIIKAAWHDYEGVLGVYASPERAKEVMDKIERHIDCQGRPAVEPVYKMPER